MSKVPCGGFKLDENFLGMNENDELSLTGGGGEGKAYQYLVTDGNGNTQWEDRLAYETEPVLTEIVSEETVSFTPNSGAMTALWPPTFNAVEGQTYIVKFDGADYTCTCIRLGEEGGPLVLGNLSIAEVGDDTGEPFLMVNGGRWSIVSSDSATEHTISISEMQVSISKIDEKFLPVASDETYGVVKKSELVTPYVFGIQAPHDKMVEAVTAFRNGTASILWHSQEVASASYDSSTDEVLIRYAYNPNVQYSYKNNNGRYLASLGEATDYGHLEANTLQIRNSDNKSIYSSITVSGTDASDTALSLNAEHLNLYSKEILNKKELILYSSTVNSTKRFKITVDDSGTISATEVTT